MAQNRFFARRARRARLSPALAGRPLSERAVSPSGGYQSAAAAAVTVCVEACVIYVFFWTRGVLFQYSPIDVLFKNLRLMSIISSFKLRWSPALTNIFVALKFSVFSVDITQVHHQSSECFRTTRS